MAFCQQTNFECQKKLNSRCMIGSQYKLSCINMNFSVKVNNTPIERVVEHTHLGDNLDESLICHSHMKFIMKKTSAGLKVLKHIRMQE